MASNKLSQHTQSTRSSEQASQRALSRLYEGRISDLRRLVTTLEGQLEAQNTANRNLLTQLSEAQSQVRMAMEDKYFHPQVTRPATPGANGLSEPEGSDYQPEFDNDGDAARMQEGGEDLEAALGKIADEMLKKNPELAGAFDEVGKEHQ